MNNISIKYITQNLNLYLAISFLLIASINVKSQTLIDQGIVGTETNFGSNIYKQDGIYFNAITDGTIPNGVYYLNQNESISLIQQGSRIQFENNNVLIIKDFANHQLYSVDLSTNTSTIFFNDSNVFLISQRVIEFNDLYYFVGYDISQNEYAMMSLDVNGDLSIITVFSGQVQNTNRLHESNGLFYFFTNTLSPSAQHYYSFNPSNGEINSITAQEYNNNPYPFFNDQLINLNADGTNYTINNNSQLSNSENGIDISCFSLQGGEGPPIVELLGAINEKVYILLNFNQGTTNGLYRYPQDSNSGLCNNDCNNDTASPICLTGPFTVQLDSEQSYYTFDINDFALDECSNVLTYENASLDSSTPNGTSTFFFSGQDDQFACGTYIVTSSFPFDNAGNSNDCAFTFTVECEISETDCPQDLSNSLIPNPGFEELANGIEPNGLSQLSRANTWEQATQATSDYYSLLAFNTRTAGSETMEMPPMLNEESNRWAGAWRIPNSTEPLALGEEYIEYIGAELLSPLRQDTVYTIKMKIGAPRTTGTTLPDRLQGDIVMLGLPDNAIFPISNQDCKQNDEYEEIGRVSIDIPEFSWREITINLMASSQDYTRIMFGLACDTDPYHDAIYFLVDDLLLIQGEDPCPSACYTITADAPVCYEDNASYTYDFTMINNMEDNSFDKLLILDQDEGFSLDLDGQTLLQLDNTVEPGQSIELSWTIEGTSSEEAEFCFDIIPYNPAGEMCCKEQHCVTLESCCMGNPIATLTTEEIDLGENACCYAIDYENICLPDYYTRLQVQMMTPGLALSVGTLANSDFTATMINPSLIELTYNNGATFPEGIYDDVMSYCVSDLTHTSPDMQEVRYSWFASVDGGPEAIVEINTETTMCPLPMAPDTCTVISEDMLYCDDNGVYHYRFKVTNLSQGEYDATVLVIGPLGDTEPTDFSQQTFPDFPDNTPGASPFLEYSETTDFLDVALPNASLGDSYSFFLSMHDYRMPLDDGDYWCCFDTLDVITLDIDFSCSGSGITESPLDHEVYPNPVQDNFILRFKRRIPADAEIIIMNTGGKIMDTYAVEKDTHFHTVDTGVYLPGLYYIMVRDEMGAVTYSKFVRS